MNQDVMVNIDSVVFGVQGEGFDINEATSVKVFSPDGELQKLLQNRVYTVGAHHAHRLALRTLNSGATLLLEGSLGAYLHGQNLVTSNDMQYLCVESLKRASKQVGLAFSREVKDRCLQGEIELFRVDLAVNFPLESEQQVCSVLTQVKRQLVECDARVTLYKTSAIYAPNDGKDYSISLYAKGPEMRRQRRYNGVDYKSELLREAEKILRVEVRLQSSELKRLGINKVGAWTRETPFDVFRQYMRRLEFLEVLHGPATAEELERFPSHLRPVVFMHKAGLDWTIPYNKTLQQRHRKALKELGYDLRCPNQLNSTPISLRKLLSRNRALQKVPPWMLDKRLCRAE
jgi:hypothetical protein